MEQSQKRKDIIKVAKLYYYGKMSQEDIASMMGISRPKVSRMIAAAHKFNIVQIVINEPISSNEETAEKIRAHFNLKKVVVVSSGQTIEAAKANIANAATDFLNSILFETIKIGISWGTTLGAFVNHFKSGKTVPKAKVVQLVGGTYSQSMHLDGQELVRVLATKLKCQPSILQAPMVVENPRLRELMLQETEVIEHFKLIKQLDIAFIGIGSFNYKNSVVYKARYVEEAQAKKLTEMKLCDVCGHQIDTNGNEPLSPLSNCVIGISLEDLKKVPMVVALCAGNEKALPILAAMHGGYLDALIIDEIAALSLLEVAKIN